MATDGTDRTDYAAFRDARGHEHPDVAAYTDLAADLREAVDGEVHFDEYAQVLYATDGSIYGARPAGVVLPHDVDDVQETVRIAAEHDAPVLPRGAGSSLAGQTVGPGCVVVDTSKYMDNVLDVDPSAQRATVQPGVVQDDLDALLADHDLKFAPDPASANRATIGGGIGNNSTGAHSVRYGITDAYTEKLTVVLADGSLLHAREVVLDSPEWDAVVGKDDREAEVYRTVRRLVEDNAREIDDRYPELKRCVSGYNLHKAVYENDDGEAVLNLAKLFVGAEGTLGVVVEATLDLVTVPDETAVALYCFADLVDAVAAVPTALEYEPSAVELMDDEVFRLAADSAEYSEYAAPIPDGCAAALMVEFDSECHSDLAAAVDATTEAFVASGAAFDVLEAFDADEQATLWKLRKAAIPLLMSLEGDAKPYPFIEDASVPPSELAEYVQDFQEVLDDHGTSAAYFAHAGVGTLHIRPVLTLKSEDGVQTLHAITEDVTSLVLDHHGAFSGEHGDGLARTEFNPKMYGPQLWAAFKELKSAFDPDWLMNPGTVVYRDEDDVTDTADLRPKEPAEAREFLRYGADYQSVEPATELDFGDEGGLSHLVELCNGCGTCRQTESDVMCPTYRASRDEIESTRGRANMLRAAISGDLPEDELYTERFQEEVLDLCVGCKACASDCPTGVDLAKLKAEAKHQYHDREGASVRERMFADVHRLLGWGSQLAPVSNWATDVPGTDVVASRLLGVAPERDLPSFQRTTFTDWFENRATGAPAEPTGHVVIVPDPFTEYTNAAPGKAAVAVLEAAEVQVEVATPRPTGRPAYSLGFLHRATERAAAQVDALAPKVADGWTPVCVEPADAVVVQDDYVDLLDGQAVERVAGATNGIMEYLDRERVDERVDFTAVDEHLTYHGHCNQKAVGTDHHAVGVLRRAGYEVDPVDSTCCGMAGSFGYETEHYDLSQSIADVLVEKISASDGDAVVTPGTSCRTQLEDRSAAGDPDHPIERVAAALSQSSGQ